MVIAAMGGALGWAYPLNTKGEVDRAGIVLADGGSAKEEGDALQVLGNWRSSHSFPLNTLQMGLRRFASKLGPDYLVAQRLKRTASIVYKLRRIRGMKLSRMQDIGGARVVVDDIDSVRQILTLYDRSRIRHTLVREKDYILDPKPSGYRSIHRVYRYFSDFSENTRLYNGLQIELQYRTAIQHAWATAVETMGTFLDQSLKSSEGSRQWLELFKQVSTGFAMLENSPTVPGTILSRKELAQFINEESKRLGIVRKLNQFRMALRVTRHEASPNAWYFLLQLSADGSTLLMTTYDRNELASATSDYLDAEVEAASSGNDVVLVAAGNLHSLRAAYPNYFLDTARFLKQLERVRRT